MEEKKMRAKDFMTKYVFSIPPDVTVHELVGLFATHPISAVPVTGDDNELLGIVAEGDLLYKKVKPRIPAYLDVLGANIYYCGFGRYEKSFRKLLATKASDLMTKEVRCVTPDTDMETIMNLMIDEHLKTVPVVEKPNRLVGIITRHDILCVIAATELEEAVKAKKEQKKEDGN